MKNDSNNRVPANKHYLSRRVGWIVFIFMLGIGGYLALPSNYYLRRALIHLLPKINQYPIFENRVVKSRFAPPLGTIGSLQYEKYSRALSSPV